MLSSLGFNAKGTGRANHGPSKHALVPSSQPSQPPPPPPAPVPKYDSAPRAAANSGGLWNRQSSYQAPRTDMDRKQPPVALSQDLRLIQVSQPASQPWPVETKYGKSQEGGNYLIYPSLDSDMYIYERSILSVDDALSSSPSSDSSSDSDLFPDTAMANLEISSTRASSSTETLESTLYTNLTIRNAITGNNVLSSHSRPPLAITAPPPLPPPPRPTSTRPPADNSNLSTSRPVIPLTRTESHRQRTTSISRPVHPVQFSGLDIASESDSETVVSETQIDTMVVDMLGASQWAMSAAATQYARSATPFRRDSIQRTASSRRDVLDGARDARAPPLPQYRDEGPRAPPGLALYGAVATPPDAQYSGQAPRGPAATTLSSSPPAPSAANPSPTSTAARAQQQQASGSPPQITRTNSIRPSTSPPQAPAFPRNGEPSMPSAAQTTAPPPPPQRRNSQQTSSPNGSPTQAGVPVAVTATTKRSVRWTDELICPSPVPLENRRRGWFNRRGDQLWTNDGHFKMAEPGQEYPPDLAHYPEPSTGWMNEEGVRIDMQHRLVPKRPLRSALKQPKSTV
ncbi:hypothetical protein GY45DRAFT_1290305 [Cubamyces sp. BRFM 1775]|nr:hypothetical protein GY45DRAFT_1290305 [Cubamyces sp. BRFM 1775]